MKKILQNELILIFIGLSKDSAENADSHFAAYQTNNNMSMYVQNERVKKIMNNFVISKMSFQNFICSELGWIF